MEPLEPITGSVDLSTPEGVRRAIESGLDLLDTDTGKIAWEYNNLGSVAVAHIEPWDPEILAAAGADPSFNLFEETVGKGATTSCLYRSPEDYAEYDPEDYAEYDPGDERDELYREIAGSDAWVVASGRALLEAYAPDRALLAWHRERDGLLTALVRDCPACWGGNFRVGPGDYVSEADWDSVLPTRPESSLYYAVTAALDGHVDLDEVAAHRGDAEWLDEIAGDYVAFGDAEVYYTEFLPGDYTPDEQLALAGERPDLFTPDQVGAWAGLIDPRDAVRATGDRHAPNPPAVPTGAELMAALDESPGPKSALAQQTAKP